MFVIGAVASAVGFGFGEEEQARWAANLTEVGGPLGLALGTFLAGWGRIKNQKTEGSPLAALMLVPLLALGLSACAGLTPYSAPIHQADQVIKGPVESYKALDQEYDCYLKTASEVDRQRLVDRVKPVMYQAGGDLDKVLELSEKFGVDVLDSGQRMEKPAELLHAEADLAGRLAILEQELRYFRYIYPACREGGEK
jgi:hypothetical protein